MRNREILEIYLNSVSKNTSETDIFPHGPKSLLTSVIYVAELYHCVEVGTGSCLSVQVMAHISVMTYFMNVTHTSLEVGLLHAV